ncbi:ATP-binding cassette domain-containing protein [Nocardia sp. ET3-3]|uniref:ATP-binding cassette domain-containing protein n=2 Tax=Nocardia terrae TaxID=2675851 RepID=A0A7K1V9I9_9NOCA|nr:ATP-binding cassette domain-containing protein [Nocardia terrae]
MTAATTLAGGGSPQVRGTAAELTGAGVGAGSEHRSGGTRNPARHRRFGAGREQSGAPELTAGGLEVFGLECVAGRRTVLSGVEFAVRAGETVGIVGPNGAGKTTLLRTLAGLVSPVAGEVVVDGRPLHRVSQRERARLVGLVGQDEQPPDDLRVGELVALGRTPYLPPWGAGGPDERAAVEAVLRLVDLDGFIGRPVSRLSGGERQRVLLARALAQRTPVLLLDEPTNHLDITHQLELLALTRELARTVVMSLHDLSLADRFCDRVLVVEGGRAHPLDRPEVALRTEILERVFGVRAHRAPDPESTRTHLIITERKALS